MPPSESPNIRLRNVLTQQQSFVERSVAQGISTTGLERAFAESLEISASLWSQIKSGRSIGDKLARQIENKCDRPARWLDESHAETTPDPAEEKFIAACRVAWRSASKKDRADLKLAIAHYRKND